MHTHDTLGQMTTNIYISRTRTHAHTHMHTYAHAHGAQIKINDYDGSPPRGILGWPE